MNIENWQVIVVSDGSRIAREGYNNKFKNKLFGLLNEREKGREWEKFLDSILIELMGYPEERKTINYYIIFAKLSSLKYLRYQYFRTTILDCMNMVGDHELL